VILSFVFACRFLLDDYVILTLLVDGALRPRELASLDISGIQMREWRWGSLKLRAGLSSHVAKSTTTECGPRAMRQRSEARDW
jgi:hypothetical protein